MAICSNCHATVAENTNFCPGCGARIVSAPQAPVTNPQAQPGYQAPLTPPVQLSEPSVKRLHCPQCKATQITPINETSVDGAVSTSTYGGRVGATKVSQTHRNYWMCSVCGAKFRNIQNLEEEIAKIKNHPIWWTVFFIISAVLSVLCINMMLDLGGFSVFFLPVLLTVPICAIVFFVKIFTSRNKTKKLREELEYLKIHCFN